MFLFFNICNHYLFLSKSVQHIVIINLIVQCILHIVLGVQVQQRQFLAPTIVAVMDHAILLQEYARKYKINKFF